MSASARARASHSGRTRTEAATLEGGTRDESSGGGGGGEARAPASTSSRASGSSGIVRSQAGHGLITRMKFTENVAMDMTVNALKQFNFRVQMQTCCPCRASLMEATRCLKRPERRLCVSGFPPGSNTQCQDCGILALPLGYTGGRQLWAQRRLPPQAVQRHPRRGRDLLGRVPWTPTLGCPRPMVHRTWCRVAPSKAL